MKKRLKGLLALTLALCLVLGMTTGIASAAEPTVYYYTNSTNSSSESDGVSKAGYLCTDANDSESTRIIDLRVIKPGDKIYGVNASGGEFVQVDADGDIVDTVEKTTHGPSSGVSYGDSNPNKDNDNKPTYYAYNRNQEFFEVPTNDVLGYTWGIELTSIPADQFHAGDANHCLNAIRLSSIPINYTIKYVPGEGATGTPNEVQFTVEDSELPSVANPVDLGFKKDGYVADSKWQLKDGSQVNVDVDISSIFNQQIITQ